MTDLDYRVFLSQAQPTASPDLPPDVKVRYWPPISATLISGRKDAILVDPVMTAEQALGLAERVAISGKNLTTIFITHGHGDHWFGTGILLERFPRAVAVTTEGVIETMRKQMAPGFLSSFWEVALPGQVPKNLVLADKLLEDSLELEGNELSVVCLGRTDGAEGAETVALHVPSIGLVVAGDATYNDVHLHLSESSVEGRGEWIAALDILESLHPAFVVAGHKRESRADDPQIIGETRQYICDFDRLAGTSDGHRELYGRMLALYPDRLNPGALWSAARAEKP